MNQKLNIIYHENGKVIATFPSVQEMADFHADRIKKQCEFEHRKKLISERARFFYFGFVTCAALFILLQHIYK